MAASSISNLFPFFTPSKPPPLPKTAPPHLSLSSDDHTLSSSKNRYGLVASTNDAAQYPFSSSTDVMSVVCPSLAYANTLFFSSGYNVEIIVEEDEPEERLLNRFRREVMRAGIIQECKRRRYYENKQDAKKRKTREAAKRNRRRRGGWTQDREEVLENKKEEDDDDATMVVVTFAGAASLSSSLHTTNPQNFYTVAGKPLPPSLFYFRQLIYRTPAIRTSSSSNGAFVVKAYMEEPNSIAGFANKVIGSLPVIGLFARILSDEGGVGGDIIDFAEFRRRVGNKCSVSDSRAFFEFQERRGKSGDPLYVLLCCWLAALGAGLLKSEEILEGVARLRLSNDIEFEEQNFISIMNEARERRAKLNVKAPSIPMEIRAEKALEAIYVCCFGRDRIEEEDEELLRVMLNAVFPTVGQTAIDRIVKERVKKVEEGAEEDMYPEPKPLSKEAVQLQMKDLEFLKQGREG